MKRKDEGLDEGMLTVVKIGKARSNRMTTNLEGASIKNIQG